MNPYLIRLRSRYAELNDTITGLTSVAAAEGRDLTEVELREVETHGTEMERVAGQVASLTAIEVRSREVADLNASILGEDDGQDDGEQLGGGRQTGNARTQDRDPGHYRSEAEGGQHSFFTDLVRAHEGDQDARTRQNEHNRALSTGVAGAGIVPPNWLLAEYERIPRQGRVLANMVRQIPITNPAPMTLQKQTAGTDNVIAEQATENTHPSETDAFATNFDVVIPKPTSGIQTVARQMIDMSSPAADLLIYGDMLAVYDRKVEDKVTAAWVAAAGTPVSTFATSSTITAVQMADAVVDAAFAVWNGRKLPADVLAMRIMRWGQFNKYRDSTGRKYYPTSDAGPMNVDGVGSVQSAGNVEGLAVSVTDGLGIGGTTFPEDLLVGRASDTILFEGAMQRFRFEEVAGPESIKLGIWAYTAVIVRQAATSVRRIRITAA